jgi:hypothetical protein
MSTISNIVDGVKKRVSKSTSEKESTMPKEEEAAPINGSADQEA